MLLTKHSRFAFGGGGKTRNGEMRNGNGAIETTKP